MLAWLQLYSIVFSHRQVCCVNILMLTSSSVPLAFHASPEIVVGTCGCAVSEHYIVHWPDHSLSQM